MQHLAEIVETGPDIETDGVVRWRRIDLCRVIKERFDVDYAERSISTRLAGLGFVHISGRPHHPGQDGEVLGTFKKLRPNSCRCHPASARGHKAGVVVARRDAARPEERPGAAMGAQGHTTAPTCRSALHLGLAVRRDLSGVGRRASGKAAGLMMPYADTDASLGRLRRAESTPLA